MPDYNVQKRSGWVKGKSGNPTGRPKGSKNKFSKIREDWLKAYKAGGGLKLFNELRKKDLVTFFKVGVAMFPKEMEAKVSGSITVEIVRFAADKNPE